MPSSALEPLNDRSDGQTHRLGRTSVRLALLQLLPLNYSSGPGAWVEFTQAGRAPMLGMNPFFLIFAGTLGASSAYMMSVGTALKTIVFGTGLARLPQMMRAGRKE